MGGGFGRGEVGEGEGCGWVGYEVGSGGFVLFLGWG